MTLKKLSIWILYPSIPLLIVWLIYQTIAGRAVNLNHDPMLGILIVPIIVSLVLCILGLIRDKKVMTASFGFHLSLLLSLLFFIGNEVTSEKGQISILEGEKTSSFMDEKGHSHSLPFEIECIDFKLALYEGSYRASSFETSLKIKKQNNSKARPYTLSVNSPIEIDGYKLFQTDYGLEPNPKHKIPIKVSGSKYSDELLMQLGEIVLLSDGSTLSIIDFSPSWAAKDEDIITFNHDALMNPGYLMKYQMPGEEPIIGWVVPSNPQSKNLGNLKVEIGEIWGIEYSVISVVKSPLTQYVALLFIITALFGAKMLWKRKK